MSVLHRHDAPRLHRRVCVSCGHDGPELQGERGLLVLICPGCHQDLYTRPARSYAEMEGIDAIAPAARRRSWLTRQVRLFRQWATLWVAMVWSPRRGRGCRPR